MAKLAAANLLLAEYARRVFTVSPDPGTPFDAILEPAYWAHVASQFKPFSRIEVNAPDNSYFAELIVLDCDKMWAKVEVLRKVDFAEGATAITESIGGLKVGWGGPFHKFRVLRGADVLAKGFGNRVDAEAWIATHHRAAA